MAEVNRILTDIIHITAVGLLAKIKTRLSEKSNRLVQSTLVQKLQIYEQAA